MRVYDWKMIHEDPDGHRLFVDQGLRGSLVVYIADQSGSNPSWTDDGPLAIDRDRLTWEFGGLTLRISHGYLVATVPVLEIANGDRKSTVNLTAGCVIALAKRWGINVKIEAPYLGDDIVVAPVALV